MDVFTIIKFLVGRRSAIGQIAGCRQAWLVGLLLVSAAALAREYDGESLMDQPWYLAIPMVASLIAATILYSLIHLVAARRGQKPVFWENYLNFVGVFWMTAPLALLYGIPYEQFLDQTAAVEMNLWTLALVATWRVLLMARVISVLFHWHYVSAFVVTMLFADTVMLIVLHVVPMPTLAIMGGIHVPTADQLLAMTNLMVNIVGMITMAIWVFGTVAVVFTDSKKEIGVWASHDRKPTLVVWAFCLVAILFWIPLLPFTQELQRNRFRVEQHLRNNRFSQAFEMMNDLGPEGFPKYWDPPPRVSFSETTPSLEQVALALSHESDGLEIWVEDIFARKLTGIFGLDPTHLSESDLVQYVDWLERTERGPEIAWSHRYSLGRNEKQTRSRLVASLIERIRELGETQQESDRQ